MHRGSRALGLVLLGLAPVAVAAPGSKRHPDSLSRTTVAIEDGLAKVRISFQSLSLIEVMDGIDVDEDLELSDEEFQASRAEIESYLVERLRFVLPGEGESDPGRVLEGWLESYERLPEALVGPNFLQWMQVELHYRTDGDPLERFDLESLFFREENPLHSDVTTVSYAGEVPIDLYFSRLDVRYTVVAPWVRRPEVFRAFAASGARDAFGMQALGLLCVLAVAVRGHARARTVLLGIVAAQVVAFFLGSFEVIEYPARLVLLAAALSVAYIGVENLVAPERAGLLWEGLGFGVVLGAGAALGWRASLEGELLVDSAGLGYAAGYFPLHLMSLLVLAWAVERFRGKGEGVNGTGRLLSVVGVGLGLVLFLQRAGWI